METDTRDHSSVIALLQQVADQKALVDLFDENQNALLAATNPVYMFDAISTPINIRRTKNIVCTLVNAGADLNNKDKSNGNTALINLISAFIIDKSHIKCNALFPFDIPSIISFLIKRGANPNIVNMQGKMPIALIDDHLQNAEMIDEHKANILRYIKELIKSA